MADIGMTAAYGSVVVDEEEGLRFVGFAEGEDEEGAYVLFRQALAGGPVWFEANDEAFGAEDAVERVEAGPGRLTITIRSEKRAALGWAGTIEVRVGPECEEGAEAIDALRAMLGGRMTD